ncbi:MAG: class I SAM-dependent methyltransferase [Polyangiaceae bacterium]|nr:class I SAM-dependent methyltransferase [Polyangiaceae bacterium]
MLQRVLEPEIMDSPEEAMAYDAMDHAEVNARFCQDLIEFASGTAITEGEPQPLFRVLDVGTGTALIPIELCARMHNVRLLGIDLGVNMLNVGRANIERAELSHRIALAEVDAKALPYQDGAFNWTISNSILHHIAEPARVVAEMWRVTAKGGVLFVRDLARPDQASDIDRLVERYGGTPPENAALFDTFEHQRKIFRDSLGASLTVREICVLARGLGISNDAAMTSDRHWTLATKKP